MKALKFASTLIAMVVMSALLTSCGLLDKIQGRIPGTGSQEDHSEGLQFAKIVVYDNEKANAAGYYDRKVFNSADPSYIALPPAFVVPADWTVERDFSKKANNFVSYYTVKPPVDVIEETISAFAEENNLLAEEYEVTSVIVRDGQECSMSGLVNNRVRVNVYVGLDWTYQPFPAQ